MGLQSSPKFGIGGRHFEANAYRSAEARPLSVISFRSRDFVLASVFVLEIMADIQPYHFEPERVPSESENE